MQIVLLTALGVGGATVLGALIGFVFKDISARASNIVTSFAAGVMLAAAVLSLIVPAVECGGELGVLIAVIGVLIGGICINLSDALTLHVQKTICGKNDKSGAQIRGVLLFVIAIAIHNLPEGIAAGVGFGAGDNEAALLIAWGIALHNIPEGMVIIAPLLAAGITPKKTFLLALATGFAEVVGTLIGYFAVSLATAVLPFALAFAGGTMLFVIVGEMIPEAHTENDAHRVTYAFLFGFCAMLVLDAVM